VLVPSDIDLLVRVSVVAFPTRVSVASGIVMVLAVVNMVEITPVIAVVFPSTSNLNSLVTSADPFTNAVASVNGGAPPAGVAQVLSPLKKVVESLVPVAVKASVATSVLPPAAAWWL